MTEIMAELVIQIGIILFAVRVCGRLVKKIGVPQVLGELLAGVIIGPYALGAVTLPGFPDGIFPLPLPGGEISVSPELYALSQIASIILLFSSGLETDIALFLRYSVAGGLIGLGGVAASFVLGDICGMLLTGAGFGDGRCLFLGVLSTATSVGITARILSDQKKMDSPEGVTILAAAVFDDVLGIIMLAVVMGIVSVIKDGTGESLDLRGIAVIGAKALGIWLFFTVAGLLAARKIAAFLKFFKSSFDFSILALGLALLLAGIFEKQGLAMIIGAYVTGLSLSKTDIAAVIQERIHGLYEFFVPLFFCVMGMMVNVREIAAPGVLLFGAVYTLVAIVAKIAGCALPALALGFNGRGALRIGMGMVPRGEVALIIAGIALASGILNNQLFAVIILMTFVTTLAAPPLLNLCLKIPGIGTRKAAKDDDSATYEWDFRNDEIADLVVDMLLKDLRAEGFYVQMMNIDEGLSQARKGDISLSITEAESRVTIVTNRHDMPFVKTAVYEVILELGASIESLRASAHPEDIKRELVQDWAEQGEETQARGNMFAVITKECVTLALKGTTKDEILAELVDSLAYRGKLADRNAVLADVLEREKSMSTGLQHGIAIPHGKTDGVKGLTVAVGIKKEGVDFGSLDGEPSRLFILIVSPKKDSGPHVEFLAGIGALLSHHETSEKIINAATADELVAIMRGGKKVSPAPPPPTA